MDMHAFEKRSPEERIAKAVPLLERILTYFHDPALSADDTFEKMKALAERALEELCGEPGVEAAWNRPFDCEICGRTKPVREFILCDECGEVVCLTCKPVASEPCLQCHMERELGADEL